MHAAILRITQLNVKESFPSTKDRPPFQRSYVHSLADVSLARPYGIQARVPTPTPWNAHQFLINPTRLPQYLSSQKLLP